MALVLGAVACGGDDENGGGAAAGERATAPEGTPERTARTEAAGRPEEPGAGTTETEARDGPGTGARPPATSPEEAPGGAGDEVPARSLALFTGRDGRIAPRVVRVPPFISVRVELRAADGGSYRLRFDGETLEAGAGAGSASTTLDGLRPGERAVGRPIGGAGNRVRIEASAEPGP